MPGSIATPELLGYIFTKKYCDYTPYYRQEAAFERIGSVENMRFIEKKGKAFIFEINDNRLAAASGQEREKGHFARIDRMEIPDGEPVSVYLKDLRFPVILYKQVFKNRDGSTGVRYLVTNDKTTDSDRFKTLYKKR
jgi:hypothetical protein